MLQLYAARHSNKITVTSKLHSLTGNYNKLESIYYITHGVN